jgi:transketolase
MLSGLGLELDDLRAFRSLGSSTPGHPETGHTPGVEVTTGPLGQGFANAVGMALAERLQRERFGIGAVSHHTWVIAGDGCLMEGVSHEAASLAGHLGLDRLICVFDDNRITIDGGTALACDDDVSARFNAYGWRVIELGDIGEDLDALESALLAARDGDGRPTLLVLRTHIGFPSPDHTDSHAAHGLAFGAEDVTRTKAVLGIPDEPFHVPTELVVAYRAHTSARAAVSRAAWESSSAAARATPEWSATFQPSVEALSPALPTWERGARVATRKAIQVTLDATSDLLPGLVAGSADLTGNTGTKVAGLEVQSVAVPTGRQVHYGVREHAMGSAMVGLALHGGALPIGGTFLVFLDYMRPPVRLAALSGARCVFVFSHDSVAVGEDGPTHQPVEHLATLRAVPGLHVIRPADANETSAAWADAVAHDGPTVLVLSRQDVEVVTDGSAVCTGAATVVDRPSPQLVIVGTGAEVSLAVQAAERLHEGGVSARVVSMPSWDRFRAQPPEAISAVLPAGVPVLSVEAASTFGWSEWADRSIGIDSFGVSAPGGVALQYLGISVDAVVAAARDMVGAS